MRKSHDSVFTVGIGGAAGDGIRESGSTLGAILTELGYESFMSFTYPSLIRGGHNFARITFSKDKVYSDHEALDVLIALNEESIVLHRAEMAENSAVLADSFEPADIEVLKENAVVVPMAATVKEMGVAAITRNSMALGALCYLLDLDFDLMQKVLEDVFKNKMPEVNIKLADKGYQLLKEKGFRHAKKIEPSDGKKEFMDGNEALARGLMAADLDFYVGYPMTPATSLLQYLAGRQLNSNLRVIQPESELAVINMALGMSYAGKRVAVGSASGGFALMQEAFSNAGMAELPLVVAVSQRQAPATGLPTYSSQTDLRFVIHAGHGEFPRIVIAPGDAEESFKLGADALNLAWKYQLPVIVLMDKIISEHAASCELKSDTVKIEQGSMAAIGRPSEIAAKASQSTVNDSTNQYRRYQITADGISPMAFPGTPNTVIKVTSYEHDESGITTEEAKETESMINKRFAKAETLKKSLDHHETVKVYGDRASKDVVVFWGSTKGPVLEAARYIKKPVKFVQIVWLEPFDTKKVAHELSGARKIINIECNRDAQMANLIKEKTGIEATDMILKFDSRPFEPVTLAERINEIMQR
jgi:2-oxoglutarate ferredoxin oxidoreductase subunit alpha